MSDAAKTSAARGTTVQELLVRFQAGERIVPTALPPRPDGIPALARLARACNEPPDRMAKITGPLVLAMARKKRCDAMVADGRRHGLTVVFASADGGGGRGVRIACGSASCELSCHDLDVIEAVIAHLIEASATASPAAAP